MPDQPATRPRLFGLTGGIGSGKSVVADMLRAHGIPVFDADEAGRSLTKPGGAGVAAVAAAFGPPVARPDGTLDRTELARRVFSDRAARATLEAILHPLIDGAACEWLAERAAEHHAVCVYVAPLLFEADRDREMEAVVAVLAEENVRVRRVVERDKTSIEAVRARMAAQTGDGERAVRADFALVNNGTLDELRRQVDDFVKRVLRPGS